MANPLDEVNGPINDDGRDVNVIAKQLPVKVGVGSTIFQVVLWLLFIIPGLVFQFMKVKARTHLAQLEQKIQHNASTVDNFLEQRVVILSNLAKLVDKAVALDKDTFEAIAKARSGQNLNDQQRQELGDAVENVNMKLNVAIENYPELRAHSEIADAIQQNSRLQKEITAARELYNDSVNTWNSQIFVWPTYAIVAAKAGYTTRIPFTTTKEIKEQARDVFF